MFDKVLDIHKCWLQDDISNKIRLCVKEYCLSHEGISFLRFTEPRGIRSYVDDPYGIHWGFDGRIGFLLLGCRAQGGAAILFHLAERFPEITSLMYVINGKCNDTITDQEVLVFKGKDHIIEEMEGLQFKVGPKSFYQTEKQ